MNIDNIKADAFFKANRAKLVVTKFSPEILMVAGVAGFFGCVGAACWATWKTKDVVEETKEYLDKVTVAVVDGHCSVEEEAEMRVRFVADAAIKVIKLYAPSAILGVVSVGALLQSRNILSSRNAALLAAYKLLEETYSRYRERLIEDFGEEVDIYLRSNHDEEAPEFQVLVKEKGKKATEFKLTDEEVGNMAQFGASQYAKFFDASSSQWRPTNEANLYFLQAQQTNVNVELQTRGHVFLSEVYDILGIPRTPASALVGWVKGHGDDMIDFGVFNVNNDFNADFINGYNREQILLDFNVDGVIWDLI